MNDARLDGIALCVFGLALATVLAPLLSINPFVPYASVAALMGALVLDQVALQGRGIDILSGGLRSPASKERLLRHEAGHLLVACALGVPVTDYVLDPWQAWRRGYPGYGGVRLDDTELWGDAVSRQTIDRFCVVWMAGAAAELRHYEAAVGAATDSDRLQRLCRLVALDPGYQERWALLRAQVLLAEEAEAYAIAIATMQAGVSCRECVAAVKGALRGVHGEPTAGVAGEPE